MGLWEKINDERAGYVTGHPWRHPDAPPLTPTGGIDADELSVAYSDAVSKISGKIFTYPLYSSPSQLMGVTLTSAYLLNGNDVTSPGTPLDGQYWFSGSPYACAGGQRDEYNLFRTAYCTSFIKFTMTIKKNWQLYDGQERWIYRYSLRMDFGPSDDDVLITCQEYTAPWKSTLDSWNNGWFYTSNRYGLIQHDLDRDDYATRTPTDIVDHQLVRGTGPSLHDFRMNRVWDYGPDWLISDDYTFGWFLADEVHPADSLSRSADMLTFDLPEVEDTFWKNVLRHEHQWYVNDGHRIRVKANGDIHAIVDHGVAWNDERLPIVGPQGDHATFEPPPAVADATTQIEYRHVESW